VMSILPSNFASFTDRTAITWALVCVCEKT